MSTISWTDPWYVLVKHRLWSKFHFETESSSTALIAIVLLQTIKFSAGIVTFSKTDLQAMRKLKKTCLKQKVLNVWSVLKLTSETLKLRNCHDRYRKHSLQTVRKKSMNASQKKNTDLFFEKKNISTFELKRKKIDALQAPWISEWHNFD